LAATSTPVCVASVSRDLSRNVPGGCLTACLRCASCPALREPIRRRARAEIQVSPPPARPPKRGSSSASTLIYRLPICARGWSRLSSEPNHVGSVHDKANAEFE